MSVYQSASARILVLISVVWLAGTVWLSGSRTARAGALLQDTDTPTPTPTSTPTPTPTPMRADLYEPNGDENSAAAVSVGGSVANLTFVPAGETGPPYAEDVDYFRFWGKNGRYYAVETGVDLGLDTYMWVYGPGQDGQLMGENDDVGTGNPGSRVVVAAPEDNFYFIKLVNIDPVGAQDPVGRTYRLDVQEVPGTPSPTPTPTNTPLPATDTPVPQTPIPGADKFEPNFDFGHATVLATGVRYDSLNFVPWPGSDPNQPDNDFFRIWVKPAMLYTCETLNLAAGTDTNMIFYLGPSFDQGGPGNDDRAPGDYSSEVSWYSTYIGWLYILVGPRWAGIPPDQLAPFTYSLKCSVGQPAPTATATRAVYPTSPRPLPTYTALPTYTPFPTPSRRPGSTAAPVLPTATPQPLRLDILPLPTVPPDRQGAREIIIDLLVYYDANRNLNPEMEEGVRDLAVAVYEATSDELVAFGYTSVSGGLHFGPLSVVGDVRVEVPLLAYSRTIAGVREQLEIRIVPRPLPAAVP